MSDILSRIDAAVESRCACGCGTQLDPAGASMWFATPDCQWRFQQQHADNPGDVYSRADAADYPGFDSRAVPLNEHWLRRAYLDAPPSAHAPTWDETHVVTDEQMEQALTWSGRLRIGGIDLSEHVRSAMLAPIAHPEDTVWREVMRGFQPGSITVSGPFEWNAAEDQPAHHSGGDWMAVNPVAVPADRVPRGIVSAVPPAPATPTDVIGDIRRFYERMTETEYEIVAPPSVADQLPGMPGVEVITSDVVPDGQVYVINSRVLADSRRQMINSISFSCEPVPSFTEDAYRFRVAAHYTPLPTSHIAIFDETVPFARFWRLEPERRRDPRLKRQHLDYSRRRKARQRRAR